MKNLKLTIFALVFPFLFNSCNKEDFFGKFQDLNNNGTLDLIQGRYSPDGYTLYYFDGNNFDTNYIIKGLKSKPINPHAFDNENNGYPNVFYWISKGDKSQKFIVKNNNGCFEETKELEE